MSVKKFFLTEEQLEDPNLKFEKTDVIVNDYFDDFEFQGNFNDQLFIASDDLVIRSNSFFDCHGLIH